MLLLNFVITSFLLCFKRIFFGSLSCGSFLASFLSHFWLHFIAIAAYNVALEKSMEIILTIGRNSNLESRSSGGTPISCPRRWEQLSCLLYSCLGRSFIKFEERLHSSRIKKSGKKAMHDYHLIAMQILWESTLHCPPNQIANKVLVQV